MPFSPVVVRAVAIGLFVLLLAPISAAQSSGFRVEFPAVRFEDTLFSGIEPVYRTAFDEAGDLWYSTPSGVVHVSFANGTRRLFTAQDGLPSSASFGLAVLRDHVYVATDLGIGVVNVATGAVTAVTTANSPLPDPYVTEIVRDGDRLWVGTFFAGVARWDPRSDDWEFRNTSSWKMGPMPVARIIPTDSAVWVASGGRPGGDGAWRYDREAGAGVAFDDNSAWRNVNRSSGLPSTRVYGVAEYGRDIWLGTDKGLVRWSPYAPHEGTRNEFLVLNKAHGLPSDIVRDVDIVPTTEGRYDIVAATEEGAWQMDPGSGRWVVRAQSFGILGSSIKDMNHDTTRGWVFATNRGVSLLRGEDWTYYTTGPSTGPSNGPAATIFTAAGSGPSDLLWFGHATGLAAYRPTEFQGRGAWYNLGEWARYPGGTVHWIDVDQGITWVGSGSGTYGFNHETGEWIRKLSTNSANIVYGLEADRGQLWVALWGDGLLWQDLATGASRSWTDKTDPALPDLHLTDVRVQDDDVWLGTSIGLTRLHRVSGSIRATYTAADGLPGDGFIFRVLPDGNRVWIATRDHGVAELDASTGRVVRVFNATTTPGFPVGEEAGHSASARSLVREGGRLWVGTTEGLVRIDVATGELRLFNATNAGLVQNYVNGIVAHEGVLYAATLSGIARLDLATFEFLPMHDGLGTHRNASQGDTATVFRPVIRIDNPRDGRGVTGMVEITGTAYRLGGTVDRVEVRVGAGEWRAATGVSPWSLSWDSGLHAAGSQVTITARALAPDAESRPAEILVTVVKLPETALTIAHDPPAQGHVGRPFGVSARVAGDEPLTAALFYKRSGQESFQRLALTRQGGLFVGAIPASDVREGDLSYYVEARSGILSVSSPEDAARLHVVPILAVPSVDVHVEGPDRITAPAGVTTPFFVRVSNTGSEAAVFVVASAGLRAAWLTVPAEPIGLAPGETRELRAFIAVPPAAFSDNTTVTLRVHDVGERADPQLVQIPLTVVAAAAPAPAKDPAADGARGVGVPGFAAPLALLAAAAVALGRRRWSR